MAKPTPRPSQGPLPTFLRESALCPGRPGLSPLPIPPVRAGVLDREQRAVERRIKAAVPGEESRDLRVSRIPSVARSDALNISTAERTSWRLATPAARRISPSRWDSRRQKGYRVRFTTAAALVKNCSPRSASCVQKQLAKQDLLIVDELGYVPFSKTGPSCSEIFSTSNRQRS